MKNGPENGPGRFSGPFSGPGSQRNVTGSTNLDPNFFSGLNLPPTARTTRFRFLTEKSRGTNKTEVDRSGHFYWATFSLSKKPSEKTDSEQKHRFGGSFFGSDGSWGGQRSTGSALLTTNFLRQTTFVFRSVANKWKTARETARAVFPGRLRANDEKWIF